MKREGRIAVTMLVTATLLAPVAFDRDSFPLSTYPMYARTRSSESTIVTAYGRTATGERLLTPGVIGDSDDPLIVAGELRAAINAGRAPERCREIAKRASNIDGVVGIVVVTERHDTVAHTMGQTSLLSRAVHATCDMSSVDDER